MSAPSRRQEALQAAQSADAIRLSIKRENVLAGLLEAVEMARDQRDPAAMVKGLAEIARMLGYQAPKQFRVAVAGQGAGGRLEGMTDDELAAVIEAGSSR